MKKITSCILAMSMMIGLSTTVFADNSSALASLNGHWSKDYITYLNSKDVIMPTGDSFTPDTAISRAEFMRYINRAFSLENKTSINYTDVIPGTWYYEEVQKAVYWGYMEGTGDGKMYPLNSLTRQEAVVIISRLHNLAPKENAKLNFTDADEIASWAEDYIATAVELGYISGRTDGKFDPLGSITRGEIAKILTLFAGNIVDKGTITSLDKDLDNVTIGEPLTVLDDVDVAGTVLVTNNLEATFYDTNIDGDLIVSGGTIYLQGTTVKNLIVKAPKNNKTTIITKSGTEIENIYMYSDTDIVQYDTDSVKNVYDKLIIFGNDMEFSGDFDSINMNTQNDLVLTDGTVKKLNADAKYLDVTLDDTTINELNATKEVSVSGTGEISSIYVSCDDVFVSEDIEVKFYDIDSGYKADINGKDVTGSKVAVDYDIIEPSVLVFRDGVSIYDLYLTCDFDVNDIYRISLNNKTLDEGDDYELNTRYDEITLKKELIIDFDDKDELTIEVDDEDDIVLDIYWLGKDENIVIDDEFDVDIDDGKDLEIPIYIMKDEYILNIYNDGDKVSTSYYDYDDKENLLTIEHTYLKTLSDGTYDFEFVISDGNDIDVEITIDGSSSSSSSSSSYDGDENAIYPEKASFNATTSSVYYDDIDVILYSNEGSLRNISFEGVNLKEDEDYEVYGMRVTIFKEFLYANRKDDEIKLKFDMSKGDDPTLTIDMQAEETDEVQFVFTNNKGTKLEDVEVTVGVVSKDTDKNGETVFYLDNGKYIVQFEKNGYLDGAMWIYVNDNDRLFEIKMQDD